MKRRKRWRNIRGNTTFFGALTCAILLLKAAWSCTCCTVSYRTDTTPFPKKLNRAKSTSRPSSTRNRTGNRIISGQKLCGAYRVSRNRNKIYAVPLKKRNIESDGRFEGRSKVGCPVIE